MRVFFFLFILFFSSLSYASLSPEFMKELEEKRIHSYFHTPAPSNFSEDFGHIVHIKPLGAFFPTSLEQLQTFLSIANTFHINVKVRGKGNSPYGQSQIEKGIIIDLSKLSLPLEYSQDSSKVIVPAAATWLDLIEFTKKDKKTVPVTIDSLDLTIGGTLSFGAVGGTSYLKGSAADNVESFDLITMDGKLHHCSEKENSALFKSALGTMGQMGVITSITIPVLPAPEKVNIYKLIYRDPKTFFHEQKILYESKAFDHLKGYARKNEKKEWEYVVEAVTYYDVQEEKNIQQRLGTLSPFKKEMQTIPYFDFINSVTQFVNVLREKAKLDQREHPWYAAFVPEYIIQEYMDDILDTPYLTGKEPILVYPLDPTKFTQSFFMKPEGKVFYLVGVLYNTSLQASADFPTQEILSRNTKLYHILKEKGGYRYPIDATFFTAQDWQNHYGQKAQELKNIKKKYDPQHLLFTPLD